MLMGPKPCRPSRYLDTPSDTAFRSRPLDGPAEQVIVPPDAGCTPEKCAAKSSCPHRWAHERGPMAQLHVRGRCVNALDAPVVDWMIPRFATLGARRRHWNHRLRCANASTKPDGSGDKREIC